MNTTIQKFTLFFTTCLLACFIGHAAEQDNWYLAKEWSVSEGQSVAYFEDNVTGVGQIYISNGNYGAAKISVYDLNGSLARNIAIATSRYTAYDLELDVNGTIYIAEYTAVTCLENNGTFKWRKGKNTSISNRGVEGTGNGEFRQNLGITVNPTSGEVFVADNGNDLIQVLDKNGNFVRKFSSNGTAPGQLSNPQDLVFLPNSTLVVSDDYYLHYFQSDGTFIKRVNASSPSRRVSVAKDGTLLSNKLLRDSDGIALNSASFISSRNSRTCFTPEGDLIELYNNKIRIWKRAYRTKGLPVRNFIPQPAVRGITQRAGTNIIDLDFEIIDPDDANATVGILAAQDGAFTDTSKWILPQTWVDGTGSKIGTPIATNQVHRVSWNVKPDWPDSTGTLKFEIICHDARRTAPVDLHFLTLPLPDGNLTISRSPLKDSDFKNYVKFLLSTGQPGLSIDSNGSIVLAGSPPPNGFTQYVFTNCGASGRFGPTWTEANASYLGTNLEGNVSMSAQGIQEWTVPETGTYVIEALGARGGDNSHHAPTKKPGFGSYCKGKFIFNQGDVLKILVGQMGSSSNSDSGGGGGGGGTFVVDSQQNPILIAGGGGGPGSSHGLDGSDKSQGLNGVSGYTGGTNGNGGAGHDHRHGGGGFSTNGIGGNPTNGGQSFLNGGLGSNRGNGNEGGFGGGGGAISNQAGGGGGYSGGGSSMIGAGGGGSYNSDVNGTVFFGANGYHGKVVITSLSSVANLVRSLDVTIYKPSGAVGWALQDMLSQIDTSYRYATSEEVQKAREAATAGGVNQWTAKRPIQPRNLPNKVNEYGFDTGDHGTRAWWVVQE